MRGEASDRAIYENIAVTSQHSIHTLFDEDQDTHALNMHNEIEISNYMKAKLRWLIDGHLTYSRPQLYQLQKLVKEASQLNSILRWKEWYGVKQDMFKEDTSKQDTVEQDTDKQDRTEQSTAELDTCEENMDDKKIDHRWLSHMLTDCTRSLSNLAGIRVTVNPSTEAYEAIVAMKQLNVALQRLSDHDQYNQARSKGKRKVEIEDECETSRCAKRMKVKFQVSLGIYFVACKRPSSPPYICGRAVDDDDDNSDRSWDGYPREPSAVRRKQSNRMTLHHASENGLESVVQQLLKEGADFEAKDYCTWTALHRAAANGCVAVVRLLLEHGADIAAKTDTRSTALHQAACNGWVEVIRLLLEKGVDIGVKDDDGLTAVNLAAENMHYEAMNLLIEHGASIYGATEMEETLLSLFPAAAKNGIEPAARYLLPCAPGYDENTALRMAVEKGYKGAVPPELQQRNIPPMGYRGTALHYAAETGRKKRVRELLDFGADIEAKDPREWTPLILAARNGHEAVAKLLVERGANVEAKGFNGWTAQDSAAHARHWAVVQLLTR